MPLIQQKRFKLHNLYYRPEIRIKDAGDIGQIIRYFGDLESETIYDGHLDLFGDDGAPWDQLSRVVIGRELYSVFSADEDLVARLDNILGALINQRLSGLSVLARALDQSDATAQGFLEDILSGFRQNCLPTRT